MTRFALAAPGDLGARTGGYLYDARILAELRGRGCAAEAVALPAAFPFADGDDIAAALARLAAVPRDAALIVDGLAYGVLPPEGIRALGRPVVALVHHPLALETGLSEADAARLESAERAALAVAARTIVTSAATAETLASRFGVAPDRIHVAQPGVDPAPRAQGGVGGPVGVLTVATVTPRKNHATLAMALGRLRDLDWRWRVAGSLDRDPATASALKDAVERAGIADRVAFLGETEEGALAAEYGRADLFALPSFFEGYGMAYAEALARGLPVVAGRGGASASVVPEAAGALVDPRDADALAAALRRLIGDPGARAAASDAAWTHAATLPRWSAAADVFQHVAGMLR